MRPEDVLEQTAIERDWFRFYAAGLEIALAVALVALGRQRRRRRRPQLVVFVLEREPAA